MVLSKNVGNRPCLGELSIPRSSSKADYLCSCPDIDSVVPMIESKLSVPKKKTEVFSSNNTNLLKSKLCTISVLSYFWKCTCIIVRSISILLIAILLLSVLQNEKKEAGYELEQQTWHLALFHLLPARLLSRHWGFLNSIELPKWLSQPLLGLYVWNFNCNMSEAAVEDLSNYSSLGELFTRKLKHGTRVISKSQLVSPTDGTVLYFGRVENGMIEQVKGVNYKLQKFLGPYNALMPYKSQLSVSTSSPVYTNKTQYEKELYHLIIYLSPGDYHHFHSPADWTTTKRRHFPGDLLSVAPWVARRIPGLFALNERVILSGSWEHGFFSMTAVGAYNVGSINLAVDETLQTNTDEDFQPGESRDKTLGEDSDGIKLLKGERVGGFKLGSTVVLIFEAPTNFQFSIKPGQMVKYGQSLGRLT